MSASGDNVMIVATSNRRHLLPEYHSDNKTYNSTLPMASCIQAKPWKRFPLSERFGLWISFYPFSQDEYLAIVARGCATWACRPRPSRRRARKRWCGPLSAARDRGGSPTSSRVTMQGRGHV